MPFDALLEHFYKTTGIEFKDNRGIVRQKITRFYSDKGYEDYRLFFDAIKKDDQLYQELINLLTTSETYFYREFHQVEVCIEKLKSLGHSIKLLCAPCASGEEPYSVLIAMLEANITIDDIEIYGIDINSEELLHAQEGVFPTRRLHKLPSALLEKYFTQLDDHHYKIIPRLQEHVHFTKMNLFEPFPTSLCDFDVIFSRNMLIYFDKTAQERAERIFYEKLRPGGYLFVGHADRIHQVTSLTMTTQDRVAYYQKPVE